MSRRETAMEYFKNGYNCSQALVMTFQDLIPVEPNLLLKMSSSFGGGMGRLREVCGAVTGMFMVAGFLYGFDGSAPERAAEAGELSKDECAGFLCVARLVAGQKRL